MEEMNEVIEVVAETAADEVCPEIIVETDADEALPTAAIALGLTALAGAGIAAWKLTAKPRAWAGRVVGAGWQAMKRAAKAKVDDKGNVIEVEAEVIEPK